jgi:hypothetical protein
MTDYRALSAELLTAWQVGDDIAGPMNRARRLLAQPEPVAPTDEELYELWEESGFESDRFARAVLAKWGNQ